MFRVLLLLITLGFPFLANATNSCADVFSGTPRPTITEGLATGLLEVSHQNIGDLQPQEIATIQQLVDLFGHNVFIIGSAAKARRRFIGSQLPLAVFGGSKSNTKSDIDYVVKSGLGDDANNFLFPDLDSSWGVRDVDYINLSSSPAIMFRPFLEPIIIKGFGRFYLN